MTMNPEDEEALETMWFDTEKHTRHAIATKASDVAFFRSSLRSAADRFDDVADLLAKKDGYDPIGFLRRSAKRYRMIADRT